MHDKPFTFVKFPSMPQFMRFILLSVFISFTLVGFSQAHWESIILSNHTFSYYVSGGEADANWNTPGFDDSSWAKGKGGFGYGDNDDSTLINTTTSVYLRKTFTIADLSVLASSLLDMDYDDGFIAYLNGKEIARSSNLTDEVPTYNSTLSSSHEAGLPERYGVMPADFIEGENLLAVQVLNESMNSSDLTSNVFLHVKMNWQDTIYSPTPDWFVPPVTLNSSNLPIVIIQTHGAEIMDDPKIIGEMMISNHPDGTPNSVLGPFTDYNGKIAIELRGETTLTKPKKSYRLETQLENGENNNVSIMGMPKENDWILYGPYMDKTFLRNDLAFHLSDVLDRYATRRQFCELVLNDDYLGLYLFEEKIKIDDNRVDIATLKPEDNFGDELTGGYIFRSDKSDPGYSYFSSGVDYFGEEANKLQYYDPSQEELTDIQKDYLQAYITQFEEALVGADFDDPNVGYNNFIDVGSFIDYLISSEITLEQDRFRFSTYFYKEKDSKGGKIHAGPIWDNNYGFGLSRSWDYIQNADVWAHQYAPGHIYWWRRMMEDPYFESLFYTRWISQRTQSLSDASLMHYVDSMANYLAEAQARNFQKWPIMGVYVFPNKFTGKTYQEDIDYLKDWILKRTNWIDTNISGEILNPRALMNLENNYFYKDTFEIELKIVADFFNRKTFQNKHFKLNNEGNAFRKDTILFSDASSVRMKIVNAQPGTKLPSDFSITVSEKVINSFSNVTTAPLGIELNSQDIASVEDDLKVFFDNGEIVIKCHQPEYLGNQMEIYNLLGSKIAVAELKNTYTNRIATKSSSRILIVRILYNGKPHAYKLISEGKY